MSEFNSFLEEVRGYFRGLRVRLVDRARKLLRVGVSSKTKQRIRIIPNGGETRHGSRQTYSTTISGSTGRVIRILHRNTSNGSSTTTAELTSNGESRISVAEGTQTCKVCGRTLAAANLLATCNMNHAIHKECVALMKNKCPDCGGRIS